MYIHIYKQKHVYVYILEVGGVNPDTIACRSGPPPGNRFVSFVRASEAAWASVRRLVSLWSSLFAAAVLYPCLPAVPLLFRGVSGSPCGAVAFSGCLGFGS